MLVDLAVFGLGLLLLLLLGGKGVARLGANRVAEIEELEQARLRRLPLAQGTGHLGIGGGDPLQLGEHS